MREVGRLVVKVNLPNARAQCNVSGAPWQCLNFLPEPQEHGSLRPGKRLVDWPTRTADGFSCGGTAGEPVSMDVARGRGNQVNEGLMSCNGILVSVDQFFQPFPAALSAV